MKKSLPFFVLTILTIFLSLALIFYRNHQNKIKRNVEGVVTVGNNELVSASIGEHRFYLFGYTSAFATVTLDGIGIYDQTISDKNGYFTFSNRFSPLSPREACLSSKDQFGRLSTPVCLPPFPTNYNTTIGPVILSPTLSLDKPYYFLGDRVVLSGQTVPNTDVSLNFYVDKKRSFVNYLFGFSLIKPVYAFSLSGLKTKTDPLGNFSFSINSVKPDFFRVFANSDFQNDNSPKSLVLKVEILPIWMLIIKLLLIIWSALKSRIFEFIILIEIAFLLTYFLRKYFLPHKLIKA